MADQYVHGHQASVIESHSWRTAENSAAYLLDALEPGMDVLDVGCGPGTITVDLATRVRDGRVLGVDRSPDVLTKAAELAVARGVENVEFEQADVYDLPYADGSFDVVHAHQVLQHLREPIAALREMKRVLRRGGLLAVRDADYGAMTWYPEHGLSAWRDLYQAVTAGHGAQSQAGRRLLAWVREVGFNTVTATASVWCFADDRDRAWWGGTWAERTLSSGVATAAVEQGLATQRDLEEIAQAWKRWAADPDGWFTVVHGEVLARV